MPQSRYRHFSPRSRAAHQISTHQISNRDQAWLTQPRLTAFQPVSGPRQGQASVVQTRVQVAQQRAMQIWRWMMIAHKTISGRSLVRGLWAVSGALALWDFTLL